MKPKLSTLVLVGVLMGHASPMLTLRSLAAQTEQRGVRVQPASQGERRVALVIGNSAYKDSPLLLMMRERCLKRYATSALK